MFTMTGKDLREFDRAGGSIEQLIADVAALPEVRVTRLDFAIDLIRVTADPIELADAVKAKTAKTHIQAVSIVTSSTGDHQTGLTVYLGSRQSTRLIRIYDKAAESGYDGIWTRIELEAKDPHALAIMRSMITDGIALAGCAAIRTMIVSGVDWFDAATASGDGVPIESVGRKNTNFDRWAISHLLPQTVRAIRADVPGFIDAIRIELANVELTHKHSQ
jgi:hypothetical protein